MYIIYIYAASANYARRIRFQYLFLCLRGLERECGAGVHRRDLSPSPPLQPIAPPNEYSRRGSSYELNMLQLPRTKPTSVVRV